MKKLLFIISVFTFFVNDTFINAQNISGEHKTTGSFWNAVNNLDFTNIKTLHISEDETKYTKALQVLLKGDITTANSIFFDILKKSNDSAIIEHAYNILAENLFFSYKWDDLLKTDSIYYSHKKSLANSEDVKYKKLYKKLSKMPITVLKFPNGKTVAKFISIEHGTPVIQAIVNGKIKNFLFDTGCDITTVFSDIIDECKITPLIEEKFEVGTATDIKIFSQYTMVDIKIESIEIKKSLAMIDNVDDYGTDKEDKVKINGILGWDIIGKLDIEIDYFNQQFIIKKPVKFSNPFPNLFRFTLPVIPVQNKNSIPLIFGYDTGAGITKFYTQIKNKIRFDSLKNAKASIGSAGGFTAVSVEIVPSYEILIGKEKIKLTEVLIYKRDHSKVINIDGMFGGDIAKKGSLHFDYTNNLFEIKSFNKNRNKY